MTTYIKDLLLPPGGPILIGLLGVLTLPWRRTIGVGLLVFGAVSGYGASIGLSAHLLARAVQTAEPLTAASLRTAKPDVILVLGGGVFPDAPEYGEATVHLRTLGRLRYAAHLARQTGLPILASGGEWRDADGVSGLAESDLMRRVLEREFGLEGVMTETRSRNTRENARYSAQILRERGFDTILLVTHAAHLPRAAMLFERSGIKVIPAPTLYFPSDVRPLRWSSWIPTSASSQAVYYLSHEILGLIWDGWLAGFRGGLPEKR